jgi:hypothetical protein
LLYEYLHSSTNSKCSSAITLTAKERFLQTSTLNGLAVYAASVAV